MKKTTLLLVFLTLLLAGQPTSLAQTANAAREAFFTNGIIPRIRIELDADALSSLRANPRKNVKATVREGDKTYRDVALHLKGETTFEPIDLRPSLTLNFDKFVSGQTFHGLDKLQLNNSTQDKSLLCEYLGSALFRAAGYPWQTTQCRLGSCLSAPFIGRLDASVLLRVFVRLTTAQFRLICIPK